MSSGYITQKYYRIKFDLKKSQLELFNNEEIIPLGIFRNVGGEIWYINRNPYNPPLFVLGEMLLYWEAVSLNDDSILLFDNGSSVQKIKPGKSLLDLIRRKT